MFWIPLRRVRFLLKCLSVVVAVGCCAPYVRAQTSDLQTQVNAIVASHHGKVSLFATQLSTNLNVKVDSDRPVQTASVIKLAILYEAMVQVRAGKARWDEQVLLPAGEAVGGSGMLRFFDGPLKLTLKDVLTMMIIVSDNTATNLAIDRFDIDAINQRIQTLGLVNTHLYKKVFKPATGPMPGDQPRFGLGKTTAREMASLMQTIGECRLRYSAVNQTSDEASAPLELEAPDEADKAVCTVALSMLKSQFYRETIPRYLPNGGDQSVASKTGSLDAVRNDVGIVAGTSGPIILSIFTYENTDRGWTVDNEAEVTIAKLSKAVVDAWSPRGLDAKKLVPGLGLVATP